MLYLRLSAEAAAQRGSYGEERYEREDFQRKVTRQYEEHMLEPWWTVVDAARDEEEVFASVETAALEAVRRAGAGGLALRTLFDEPVAH